LGYYQFVRQFLQLDEASRYPRKFWDNCLLISGSKQLSALAQDRLEQSTHVLQRILQLCSRFEPHHRNFGELDVAAKIVGIEDRIDIPKAVAGESCDLRYGRVGKSEPHHR
jgi:hypothetical protein